MPEDVRSCREMLHMKVKDEKITAALRGGGRPGFCCGLRGCSILRNKQRVGRPYRAKERETHNAVKVRPRTSSLSAFNNSSVGTSLTSRYST